MEISKTFLMAFWIALGAYLLYRLIFSKSKFEEDYERTYNKILTSEEYKVKGQYNK